MAKIITSAIIADIKGTVGGNVFASNKGGNYVRRYKKPVNANSVAQQNVRNIFGANSGNWRTLTEEQRQSWITGAPNFPYLDNLGQTKIYSGQQLFNSLNNNLQQIGVAALTTCPIPQSFPTSIIGAITCSETDQDLIIVLDMDGASVVPTAFTVVVEGTTSMSSGINSPKKGLFKKIATEAAATATTTNDMGADYTAIFGAFVESESFFVGVKLISTASGEASTVLTAKVVPTA